MKRSLALVCLVVGLAAACGSEKPAVPARATPTPTLQGASATAAGARAVTDMTGRSVSVPASVSRVIALSPTSMDLATALGLQVIGKASDAGGADAPAVGSSLTPDFAAMAKLQPDLVIGDAAYQGSFTRDFERFPYPVYIVKVLDAPGVLSALLVLGDATGRGAEAKVVIDAINARVEAAKSKAGGRAGPSVLIVTGQGREVYGASEATYAGGLAKLLGATNVLGATADGGPLAGFATVELTQLATRSPDIVLVISRTQGQSLAADLKASPAWSGSKAVTTGRVYELDPRLFLRAPGPGVAEAMEKLAALLYGG